MRERLTNVSGDHVLHLGCATGEASAELIELGALVTGVDPSAEALAVARDRVPDAVFLQAALHELPLQFRRGRFNVVYAGEGTLAGIGDLAPFLSGVAAALRKNGRLFLYDWHPVSLCVDPVDLRWRESYFGDELRRLGQIVAAVARSGLRILELEEFPPPPTELGGRLDPRVPTDFLVVAARTEVAPTRSVRAKR